MIKAITMLAVGVALLSLSACAHHEEEVTTTTTHHVSSTYSK